MGSRSNLRIFCTGAFWITVKKIINFGKENLIQSNFKQVTPLAFEKALDGLFHGIGFVKGSGGLSGKFTVDIYWRFAHSPIISDSAMDYCQRIGELSSGRDEWFPIEEDKSYEMIYKTYINIVEPFFKTHETIEQIIKDYEEGHNKPELLFGVDHGWRSYNIGFCYLWIGNNTGATKHLKEVVEKYSDLNFDWIQERKKAAEDALKKIKK